MTKEQTKKVRFRIKHGRFICTANYIALQQNYIKRAGNGIDKKKENQEKVLHRHNMLLQCI
jgi:hypothetical protein